MGTCSKGLNEARCQPAVHGVRLAHASGAGPPGVYLDLPYDLLSASSGSSLARPATTVLLAAPDADAMPPRGLPAHEWLSLSHPIHGPSLSCRISVFLDVSLAWPAYIGLIFGPY